MILSFPGFNRDYSKEVVSGKESVTGIFEPDIRKRLYSLCSQLHTY